MIFRYLEGRQDFASANPMPSKPHLLGSFLLAIMKPVRDGVWQTVWAKKKDLQLALQVLAFLVGPPGVEPGTNGL